LKKLAGANEHNTRNIVLPEEQVNALVRLAYKDSVEFGYLVETMAITGARRSQLARLTVADLQDARRDPRLQMPTSKKGKAHKRVGRRAVPIPASLAAKLRAAAASRAGKDPLLVKPDGEPWGINDLRRPFREIVAQAGLDPDEVTSYALRHTSITRQLLAGIPIRVVAHMHDSSVPMLEATYSASIGDHSDALYRKALPDFGAPDDVKVVPIGRRS
jgi:integrase